MHQGELVRRRIQRPPRSVCMKVFAFQNPNDPMESFGINALISLKFAVSYFVIASLLFKKILETLLVPALSTLSFDLALYELRILLFRHQKSQDELMSFQLFGTLTIFGPFFQRLFQRQTPQIPGLTRTVEPGSPKLAINFFDGMIGGPAWNMVPRLKWQSHQRRSPMGN